MKYLALLTVIGVLLIIIVRGAIAKRPHEWNCSDFDNQRQAQQVFKSNQKDIYRLDKDKDGNPCESLPK